MAQKPNQTNQLVINDSPKTCHYSCYKSSLLGAQRKTDDKNDGWSKPVTFSFHIRNANKQKNENTAKQKKQLTNQPNNTTQHQLALSSNTLSSSHFPFSFLASIKVKRNYKNPNCLWIDQSPRHSFLKQKHSIFETETWMNFETNSRKEKKQLEILSDLSVEVEFQFFSVFLPCCRYRPRFFSFYLAQRFLIFLTSLMSIENI